MKKVTITLVASAALALAMPLYAADKPVLDSSSQQQTGVTQQQTDQMQSGQQQTGVAQQQTDTMRSGQMQTGQTITAEELKGMEVVSQSGEELGEIKTVMIDQDSGDIKFVTISKGGILGMGGEEIAVPLSAFEIGEDQARLTVDQSKLDNVPAQNAEATDSDYQRDLETHYGVAPAWETGNQGDTTQNPGMDQNPTEPRKTDIQN